MSKVKIFNKYLIEINSALQSIYSISNNFNINDWDKYIYNYTNVSDDFYDYVNGKPIYTFENDLVSTVKPYLFREAIFLSLVSLPNCNKIGEGAFYNCTSLEQLNLPACSYIGNNAFQNCTLLTLLDFPNCNYIGYNAFRNCNNITTLTINTLSGEELYSDQVRNLYNCMPNINSLTLYGCTSIGNSAFQYCGNLTSVNLPICNFIGSNAFANCGSLNSINSPLCTCVERSAFKYCFALKSINMPLCQIKSNAFYSCYSIEDFTCSVYISKYITSSIIANMRYCMSRVKNINLLGCELVDNDAFFSYTYNYNGSINYINMPICSCLKYRQTYYS